MARTITANRLLTTAEAAKMLDVTPTSRYWRADEFGMKDGDCCIFQGVRGARLHTLPAARRSVLPALAPRRTRHA